jgi:dihydroorotate dehydrogenase electron transfer subunit
MSKHVHSLKIVSKKRLNTEFFRLKLTYYDSLPEIHPAQFAEVLVEDSPETFLRRPISVHDVDYDENTLTLLIRIAGKGTEKLSQLKKGQFLNLVYPLGNTFSMPENNNILLVGGGCGVAPLLYTARVFSEMGFNPTSLLGYRDAEGIVAKKAFKKFSELMICTENGSFGYKGNVLQHHIFTQKPFKFEKIYACGPESMLKKLGEWAIENNVHCEVSLENLMACGIGACLCCIQNTTEGNKCVCVEGPVFNVKDIIW